MDLWTFMSQIFKGKIISITTTAISPSPRSEGRLACRLLCSALPHGFLTTTTTAGPTLFVDSYLMVMDETVRTYVGKPHNAETLKLYRNKHDGTFEDVTEKVGLDKVYMPMGGNFGDLTNDGFLDVYLGSGNPNLTALVPYVLFKNKEGKSFVDITQSSGTGEWHKGHAVVFADLTRQGNEDILTRVGGAIPSDEHNVRVFENPGNRTTGSMCGWWASRPIAPAWGLEIHVTVQDGNDAPRSIYRTVGQTSSFGGNPMEQHIGLGPNAHESRWISGGRPRARGNILPESRRTNISRSRNLPPATQSSSGTHSS
jgi:hypothetical protein